MLKNWMISLGYFFVIFLISTFILTFFNYFDLLSTGIISILKLLIPIVSIFISGYQMGTHSKQKGYLEGIKIGLTIVCIFMFFVLLVDKFEIKSLLYYFILLLTSILSSMLGINRKKI